MSDHLDTRNKLKSIPKVVSFDGLLNESTLSDTDKSILRMHYLEHKDLKIIAGLLGFSESAIKKRHKKSLAILKNLL